VDEFAVSTSRCRVTGAGRGNRPGPSVALASRGAKVIVADAGVGSTARAHRAGRPPRSREELGRTGCEAVTAVARRSPKRTRLLHVGAAIERFVRIDVVRQQPGISDKHPFH